MAGSMNMHLNDYLDAVGKKKWCWGVVDCHTFAADWAMILTGKDPAEGLRGTYTTAEEAHAIVNGYGDILDFMHQRLSNIGMRGKFFMNGPQDGDIGLINVKTWPDAEKRWVPAIHQGGLWLSKSLRGIAGVQYSSQAYWRA